MKEKTNAKGITLVALVVTIVILLILAGVSINLVLGNNGIIAKSKDAKKQTEQAITNDEALINGLYDEMLDEIGELPTTENTKPYLPTGFSKVKGTDLSTGLVIEDSTGNQYVWVEVPKTAKVYQTAGLAITNFTDEEYTKIENDLHEYTKTYRNGTSNTDTYEPDTDNTGWFADEGEYNTAKKQMLQSVYKNGGFYVGRYETGIVEAPRTANGETTQTPVIKKDAYPYNYVTRTQAKELAERMEHGDRTSSLMFGVQWDLVLKHLETKGTPVEDLNSNSTNLGNYKNNLCNITNTSAKYSENSGITWQPCPKNKTTEQNILLTTGADESFSKMNICDIAGNVGEWTLEKTSISNSPCASRGGIYNYYGSIYSASSRIGYSTTYSNNYYGTRFSLY